MSVYRQCTSATGIAKIRRKTDLTLNPLIIDADEGAETTITGRLTEASGPNADRGIPDKTIHFLIDDEEATFTTTDANGAFTLSYTWVAMGDYTYRVEYLGD